MEDLHIPFHYTRKKYYVSQFVLGNLFFVVDVIVFVLLRINNHKKEQTKEEMQIKLRNIFLLQAADQHDLFSIYYREHFLFHYQVSDSLI